jgi:dienelactone hydrolase
MLLSFTACVNGDKNAPDSDTVGGTIAGEGNTSDDTSGENTSDVESETTDKKQEEKEKTMEESLLSMCETDVSYKEWPEFNPVGEFEGIKAITYDGATVGKTKKTKVFAYLGFPEGASAENPVPAVVLVHGGQAGIPFAKWVKEWNKRGYAAISMSTNNFFPKNAIAGDRNYAGQLENWNQGLYGVFTEKGYTTAPSNGNMNDSYRHYTMQWMYHAVSDCILAGNILRADERVDSELVGICGNSWGATVASIAIGYDTSYAFALAITLAGCTPHSAEHIVVEVRFI